MTKILIISDTHGLIRPEVIDAISEVDHVIHAGDVDNLNTYLELNAYENMNIVSGNNDFFADLPMFLELTFAGKKFFVVHDKDHIPRNLSGVDVVIFGHSHKAFKEERNGVLYLNPGSAGRARFDYGLSMGIIEIENGNISYNHIIIEN